MGTSLLLPQLLHCAADARACTAHVATGISTVHAAGSHVIHIADFQCHDLLQLWHATLAASNPPPSASFVKPSAVITDRPITPARTGTWIPRGM